MKIGCSDTGMNTFAFGILKRFGGDFDILLHPTCKRTNGWPGHRFRDFHHRFKIARARHRKTCLDHIHAKLLKGFGYLNFFYCIQLASGHLFAVAQSSVKNKKSVHILSIYNFIIYNILLVA